ncbi:unnamed protein product [Rhodiola kirilowii]
MKRKSESETTINHLPEDVLCQIFSHIDLNSTSLVSKLFCSLSSPLLHELYLSRNSSLTYSDLQMLFNRFTGVKKIYMINCLKLDNVLMAISNSGKQQQQQLIEFIHMFPSLIEFDFTHLWDDNGIHKITLKLPNLQKVNIGYNIGAVTDKTLDILSSNCPKLDTVNFHWMFTPKALYTFFLNNPQLSSVHMPEFYSHSISEVAKCMQVLQNLSHLSLESNIVQDAVLIALAKSRPPLKSLRLGGCDNNYTMGGLIPLLSACPGLEELKIHLPVPNNNTHDAEMSIAVTRLPELKHIEVWYCTLVCQATLFSLVQNCPLLETIWVGCDSKLKVKQVWDQGMARPTKRNYCIKSILISPKDSNILLLSTLESYCPNLGK